MFKFLLLLFFSINLFSDSFHNINNFFGERAAGMAGAYSAISDEVSGTYYNPGGIAFAQNSYYSINASSYNTTKITHKNLFGPGQNYNRTSRNYLPNFIGFIKKLNKWTFGFSVLNEINQSFDQSDRIILPIYRRNLSQLDISFTEENFRLLAGPSLSYSISDKLGIGITTYYMYDSNRVIVNSNENQFNNTVTTVNLQERRRTSSILPVLGIQYMLTEKFSLGLSLRRIFVTGGSISERTNLTIAGRTGGPSSIAIESSSNGGSRIDSYNLTLISPSSFQIPQVSEVRFGWAYFLNKKLTVSSDIIYTSGYKLKIANNSYDISRDRFTYNDPYANDLRRNQTLNYSFGTEFYITDNFVLRAGSFSNFSNNEEIKWSEAALYTAFRQLNRASMEITINNNLGIIVPEKREQHINLIGYSFAIGFENSKNSISLTFVAQNGKGIGTIDRNQLPTTSMHKENIIYLSGSSRY